MARKQDILENAQKLQTQGKLAKALVEFEKYVQLDPKDFNVRKKLGDLYQKLNRNADAFAQFEAVARHFTDTGFYPRAAAIYKQMQKIDPTQIEVYDRLADLSRKQGMTGQAAAEYNILLELLEKGKRHAEAAEVLGKLLQLDPGNIGTRVKLAEAHARAGSKEKALEELQTLTAELKKKGEFPKLRQICDAFLRLFPDDLAVQAGLARNLILAGETQRGLQVLQGLLKKEPEHPEVLYGLAQGYRKLQDFENERLTFRLLLKVRPDDLDLHKGYARACLDASEPEKALEHLEEAKRLFTSEEQKRALAGYYEKLLEILPASAQAVAGATLRSLLQATGQTDKLGELDGRLAGATPSFLAADEGELVGLEELEELDEADEFEEIEELEVVEEFEELEEDETAATEEVTASEESGWLGADAVEAASFGAPAAEEPDFDEFPVEEDEEFSAAAGGDESEEDSALEELMLPVEEADLDLALEIEYDEGELAAAEESFTAPAAEEEPSGLPGGDAEEAYLGEEDALDLSGEVGLAVEAPGLEGLDLDAQAGVGDVPMLDGLEAGPPFAEESPAPPTGFVLPGEEDDEPLAADDEDELGSLDAGGLELEGNDAEIDLTSFAPPSFRAPEEALDLPGEETLADVLYPGASAAAPFSLELDLTSPSPAPPAATGHNLHAELEEAEFYLQQGLLDEAEALCRGLAAAFPGQGEVEMKLAEIAALRSARPVAPAKEPEAEDFFDLASELSNDGAFGAGDGLESLDERDLSRLDGILNEFKKGIESQIDKDDTESHYNLGIAYKEMGLLDDAIVEFDRVMKDPKRLIDCLTLKGICYAEKGDFSRAEQALREGLTHAEASAGERMGLNYELGMVYEAWNRPREARQCFQRVAEVDPAFRDVARKLAGGNDGAAPPPSDDGPGGARHKRISYI